MRSVLCLAICVLIVGCGSEPDNTGETTTTADLETTTDMGHPSEVSLPDGFPGELLEEILIDAADRTGIPTAEIEVVSVEAKTFSDAALGCPEPGKMYAQVLTQGFIVLLRAAGEDLDFRVSKASGSFVLCE